MPPIPPIPPAYLLGVTQQFEKFAAPQPTLLTVYLANVTAYYQDTVDLMSLAALPDVPIDTANLVKNNFFPLEVVGDIVQINDDITVKGLYLSKNLVTKSSPAPAAGTVISDAAITGFRHDIFKILYPDPMAPATTPPTTMEIGSITAAGCSGKPAAPGGPLATDGTPVFVGGDWAITGGTGAFLGVTGQMGGQGGGGVGVIPAPVIRAASVTEDPSKRRINALPNNTQTMFLYVIPMMPPQIIEVFAVSQNHPPKPVTKAHPAKSGDTLILYATGLGPVRDQNGNDFPIGQPFPANATVISPVTVTIGNLLPGTFAPQSAQGYQGFSNGYVVELILPNFILGPPETTPIQISSAWIQSAAVPLHLA
jgi:uncharacterized protein (TIGR03437 family)